MTALDAYFYDGKTSNRHPAYLHLQSSGELVVNWCDTEIRHSLESVKFSSRLGNTRRLVYFLDGSQCEIADNDALDAFLAQHQPQASALAHKLESKVIYAGAALIITAVAVWATIAYGVPALARSVAFALPANTERALGDRVMKTLDGFLFFPSKLPELRQKELKAKFAQMVVNTKPGAGYVLELRESKKIGANALALPSGIVVMTDEMVQLAKHDEELVAVLAHELGHLEYRHGLRHALQSSGVALVIAAVVGDIASTSAIAAALPTVLLEAKYSRAFEIEADKYALQYLKTNNIPLKRFADILSRMQDKHSDNDSTGFLSSHPATKERIQAFLNDRSTGSNAN